MIQRFSAVAFLLAIAAATPLAAQKPKPTTPGVQQIKPPAVQNLKLLLPRIDRIESDFEIWEGRPTKIFVPITRAHVFGANFGAAQGDRQLVLERPDGNLPLVIESWSNTEIIFRGPNRLDVGVSGPADVAVGIWTAGSGFAAKKVVKFYGTHGDRDFDGDGAAAGVDCDNYDPRRYPGAVEVADFDGVDEDCDPATVGVRDADGDGYTDDRVFNITAIWPQRANLTPPLINYATARGDDCNDSDYRISPRSQELPNRLDDDCNGVVDDLAGDWSTKPK